MANRSDENLKSIFKQALKNKSFFISFIIFLAFYVLTVIQDWDSITFILIPIISFCLFIFLKVLYEFNLLTKVENSVISFEPLGDLERISNRVFIFAIIEIIIVALMGLESLLHPQLIDNYFVFYIFPLVGVYIFSFYYVFHDLGLFTKIFLRKSKDNNRIQVDNQNLALSDQTKSEILSCLKIEDFKKTYNFMQLTFFSTELIWLLFTALDYFGIFSFISLSIPGTELIEGTTLSVSFMIYIILVIYPILFIIFIKRINLLVKEIDMVELNKKISRFSEIEQVGILKILDFYIK